MDKYMITSMLKGEEGINGLRIIPRILTRPQDKASKRLIPEPIKETGELRVDPVSGLMKQTVETGADFRSHNSSGQALEDYCITGEGRTAMVIREVQNSVPGMKKYALIDLPENVEEKKPRFGIRKKEVRPSTKPVYYNVRYVYSEHIDIEKMAEDEEYAKAVISLLAEKRLQQKQTASEELGLDVVYVGTITKGEQGYVKSGIRDYATAVTGISSKLDELKKEAYEPFEKRNAAEKRREKEEDVRVAISNLDEETEMILLEALINKRGVNGIAQMLRVALENRKKSEQADSGTTNSGKDTSVQEYYEW